MIKNLQEKQLFKGIGAVLLHFTLGLLAQIPFIFLYKKKLISQGVLILLSYIIVMLVFILIYRKRLITDLKDFKKNCKGILLTTLKLWAIGFVIMIVFSNIIRFIPIKDVANQEANIEFLKSSKLIACLIYIVIAPITEEIAYRLSFRKFTDNKWLFAITTGLIFGLVHILSSINSANDLIMLLYLIPYGALGIVFGLAYHKTDNIYGTMIFHSLHNTISILELILIGGILL